MKNSLIDFKDKITVDKFDDLERHPYKRHGYSVNIDNDINSNIVSNYDLIYKSEKLEVSEAFDLYLTQRSLRHDVWVDFLDKTKKYDDHNFGDVSVTDFIIKINKTERHSIPIPSSHIGNLTPDILMYISGESSDQDYIILGDVAVTVTKTANTRKYTKYKCVLDYLAEYMRIMWEPFIVSANLDNINPLVASYVELGVIIFNTDMFRDAVSYHNMCNSSMEECKNKCVSLNKLNSLISMEDKMDKKSPANIELDYESLDNEIEPVRSEDDIIGMIKDHTNELMKDEYFDTNIQQSMNKFDVLFNNYKYDGKRPKIKSTLQVVANCHEYIVDTNHNLLIQYINDLTMNTTTEYNNIRDYILSLLPNLVQIDIMKQILNDKNIKGNNDKVYGPYHYKRQQLYGNLLRDEFEAKIALGKKHRNKKEKPNSIHYDDFGECVDFINNAIRYYGSKSNKTSFLDDSWDSSTLLERENSLNMKEQYDYVKSTNGAQLCHSLSNLYQRLTHTSSKLSQRDTFYIPPNGSFVAIIPKEHTLFNRRTCDIPFIFLTRYTIDGFDPKVVEFQHLIETSSYIYCISKLFRLNIDKMSHWNQAGYQLVASCSFLLATIAPLRQSKETVVGTITHLLVDSHQRTSLYMDLLKYIGFMPFAEKTVLSSLIDDKLNMITKTKLDIWLLNKIREFIYVLGNIDHSKIVKPAIILQSGSIFRESLGLDISLPSFCDNSVYHTDITTYIEEMSILNMIRPKHLYGSQFMDESLDNTVTWNMEYLSEADKYGKWVIDGSDSTVYPFDSKYSFSKDAIIYAMNYFYDKENVTKSKVDKELSKTNLDDFLHNNCSLRGCTRAKEDRKNPTDYHTTSIEACLSYYEKHKYDQESCKVLNVAKEFVKSKRGMQFSMSEKDQRGSGRPIATPTLEAKAALMVLEKPELAIGLNVKNNIIVPGKNKLKELSDCYTNFVASAVMNKKKYIYQITEDQSKFSESDNLNKYIPYITNNQLLDSKLRRLQLDVISKLFEREHLTHRLPISITSDKNKSKFINEDRTGIKAIIGWPQGMLNYMSTSLHSIADLWITYAYNKAYNTNIMTRGLVHSDDSWVVMACDDIVDFARFCIFRILAKKMFCLKLNLKKLWISKYLGEMVSNFNINGNVHLSVVKTICNSFNNLMYMNWIIDVLNQISTLQQCYRNGSTMPVQIMLSTVLRQQLVSSYQVKKFQKENLYNLPIELGGYPKGTVFELSVGGVTSHYRHILNRLYSVSEDDPCNKILLRLAKISYYQNRFKSKDITDKDAESNVKVIIEKDGEKMEKYIKGADDEKGSDDYENVTMAVRQDIFTAIRHIMPKSKKINNTIKKIRELPFEGNGLEMVITKPIDIETSLGNFKTQTGSIMYMLSSDSYSASPHRMAISQSLQSSGKVIKLLDMEPMDFNTLYETILNMEIDENIGKINDEFILLSIKTAFDDGSSIPEITNSIVNKSVVTYIGTDKRKIINRMPYYENQYNTISPLKDVLLYIVDDELKTDYLKKYGIGSIPQILVEDASNIKRRFNLYFRTYNVKFASNLIMQEYYTLLKSRLWMQPYLKNVNLETFLCDLYGKTLNMTNIYKVNVSITNPDIVKENINIVNTIYTMTVLDSVYKGNFIIDKFDGIPIERFLSELDYGALEEKDEYLKYAIVRMIYGGDIYHMINYDEHHSYDQHYIKPQKYIKSRREYMGDFICIVRFKTTVLKIEGEPENIKLTSNENNSHNILLAMFNFINRNFKNYRYKHYTLWSSSSFWRSKTDYSNMHLVPYGTASTLSTDTKHRGYPILIDIDLKYSREYIKEAICDYEMDDYNRVVYKIDNVKNRRDRVAYVNQSLDCPYWDKVQLLPTIINGYNNHCLLNNNILVNITMENYNKNTKEEYKNLAISNVHSKDISTLAAFVILMLKDITGDFFLTFKKSQYEDVVESLNINLEEKAADTFIESEADYMDKGLAQTMIDPGLLLGESIEGTYKLVYHKRIVKHEDLEVIVNKRAIGITTKFSVKDLIIMLFNDTGIKKFIDTYINMSDKRKFAYYNKHLLYVYENSPEKIDPDIVSFIIGNRLDDPEYISEYGIKDIYRDIDNINPSSLDFYRISNKMKSAIMEHLAISSDGVDYSTVPDDDEALLWC